MPLRRFPDDFKLSIKRSRPMLNSSKMKYIRRTLPKRVGNSQEDVPFATVKQTLLTIFLTLQLLEIYLDRTQVVRVRASSLFDLWIKQGRKFIPRSLKNRRDQVIRATCYCLLIERNGCIFLRKASAAAIVLHKYWKHY